MRPLFVACEHLIGAYQQQFVHRSLASEHNKKVSAGSA